jgi:multidrug resistance efflux pump
MTLDTPSATPGVRQSPGRPGDDRLTEPRRPWWTVGCIAVAVLAVGAAAVALIAGAIWSRETGPRLAHRITRGSLLVTAIEQGLLESAENREIKCKVRGHNTVIWVIGNGTVVKPGDELVRLETRQIQEQIDERTKYALWSRSAAERSAADLARAHLAVSEYEQGRYVSELMKLESDFVVAEANLQSARDMLSHARMMAEIGYMSELDVEERDFALAQAKLDLEVKKTDIDVLKRFTQAEQLQTLKGALAAAKATHKADVERAVADASRRDRALAEIKHCVVKAERSGLVIHPNAAQWEIAPIAAGSTVHMDQILLLMPDLLQMQVKVGIHESVIDRVKAGLSAKVTLADRTIDGTVSSVASVTRPAGWWTGNAVRYDTKIRLPAEAGLMPGMSAEVEILIARYDDVLTIPVAAIAESEEGSYCVVKTAHAAQWRALVLGDSNDVFTIVKEGLEEGDEVILHPLAVRGAQPAAKETRDTGASTTSHPTSQ